nr:reverse transcriptase domain-containing protein [Tanacetum cinerariifolium]
MSEARRRAYAIDDEIVMVSAVDGSEDAGGVSGCWIDVGDGDEVMVHRGGEVVAWRWGAHALVKKKGKAKDEFYGKLILDLGNEVRSGMKQETAAMEKLVEKLGNAEDKVECKKLKKELEEARISKCAEGKKVRFAAATLQVPALSWWNAKGLTDNIKGEVTSSRPVDLSEAVRMAHKLMDQKAQARDERILEGKKRKWGSFQSGNSSGKEDFLCVNDVLLAILVSVRSSATCVERLGTSQGHTRNQFPKKVKQEEVGEVRGRAYAIKDVEPKGPNMVTGTFLLINRYAFVLFNSGLDRSFVDTRFSSMLDIDPVKIEASYEVELDDGRVVSTNTVLKGCTLNLVNRVFEIDLMPIELGTYDIIIGMDWIDKHDAFIVYGERVVRIPYRNKMLIVERDKGVSRLKVISCIKACKYVERGCHLFLAHMMEDKSKEKRMKDVPVTHDFPKVFLEELPGLPPPRQVEFRIDLVPWGAPVARAPYRLVI